MARDPAHRSDTLATAITIIQVRTQLLRRQLRHRDDLTDADQRWLEVALRSIELATHQMAAVLVDEALPQRDDGEDVLAFPRLLALPEAHHRN